MTGSCCGPGFWQLADWSNIFTIFFLFFFYLFFVGESERDEMAEMTWLAGLVGIYFVPCSWFGWFGGAGACAKAGGSLEDMHMPLSDPCRTCRAPVTHPLFPGCKQVQTEKLLVGTC
ncbi:hypothetical protein F5B20DRAFT_547643 [Whalleya microplaca]|nr:hypothetical protein F5B20DRAFT_547643 [Whalleya microplaca]